MIAANTPRSGAPRENFVRECSRMVRIVKKSPKNHPSRPGWWFEHIRYKGNATNLGNTLRREGLRKGRARKVPLLAKRHVDARIKYANDLINKEQDCFRNILWSDECRVQLFSNNYTEIEWCQPTKKTQYLPWSIVVIASCNGNAFHLWVLNILMSSMKQWIPPSIEPL